MDKAFNNKKPPAVAATATKEPIELLNIGAQDLVWAEWVFSVFKRNSLWKRIMIGSLVTLSLSAS